MTGQARALARELISVAIKPVPNAAHRDARLMRVALQLEEALNADEPQEVRAEEDESVERFRLVAEEME